MRSLAWLPMARWHGKQPSWPCCRACHLPLHPASPSCTCRAHPQAVPSVHPNELATAIMPWALTSLSPNAAQPSVGSQALPPLPGVAQGQWWWLLPDATAQSHTSKMPRGEGETGRLLNPLGGWSSPKLQGRRGDLKSFRRSLAFSVVWEIKEK